jgi:hypothetical protein
LEYGDTDRIAPLPFQVGAVQTIVVESIFTIKQILQSKVSVINPDDDGSCVTVVGGSGSGGGGNVCPPIAILILDPGPIATITCEAI